MKNEWSPTSSSPIFRHGVERDNVPSLLTFDSVYYLTTMRYIYSGYVACGHKRKSSSVDSKELPRR